MSEEIYRAIGRLEGKVDAIAERQRTMDNKLYMARGTAAADPWDLADGSVAVTPA